MDMTMRFVGRGQDRCLWVLVCLTLLGGPRGAWASPAPCPEACSCSYDGVVNCSGAKLSFVPSAFASMESNPAWTFINLQENEITDIGLNDLDGVKEAEELILSLNKLRGVLPSTFRHLTRLLVLDLSFNRIETLEAMAFQGLTNLSSLKLAGNRLSHLAGDYFRYVPHLTLLDLSDNPGLVDLPQTLLYRLPHLQQFYMNHLPGVQHIDYKFFEISTQLKYLEILNTSISQFPSAALRPLSKSLNTLEIGFNRIRILESASLVNFTKLEVLELNHMTYLHTIASHALVNLTTLQKLFVWNCSSLEFIHESAFSQMIPSTHYMSEVSLRYNSLASLSPDLLPWQRVATVDLQGNPWHCDCQLRWLPDVLGDKVPATYARHTRCYEPRVMRGAPLLSVPADEFHCLQGLPRLFAAHATLMTIFISMALAIVLAVLLAYLLYKTKALAHLKSKYQPLYLDSYNMEVKRDKRSREMFAELKPYRETTRDLDAAEPVNV